MIITEESDKIKPDIIVLFRKQYILIVGTLENPEIQSIPQIREIAT